MGWNHTLSVKDGSTIAGRCCSFHATPLKQSPRSSVHKGVLLGEFDRTDAVVKAYHGQDSNSVSREVDAALKMYRFADEVARRCSSSLMGERVRLARTFHSKVDKVGWSGKLQRKLSSSRRHVQEDDPVLIQEHVKETIQELFSLSQSLSCLQTSPPDCLIEVVRKSYHLSNGNRVIGAIKGAVIPEPSGVTYILTSLTIHSRGQEFGEKDLGVCGLEMFEHWICTSPAQVLPSAPPAEVLDHLDSSLQSWANNNIFMWPPVSAPQQPASGREGISCSSSKLSRVPGSSLSDNRREERKSPRQQMGTSVDWLDGGEERLERVRHLMGHEPELRNCCTERMLTAILGPVPAYSG